MENKNHLYMVGFGDSSLFRVEYAGTCEQLAASPLIRGISDALAAYIRKHVAQGSHAWRYAVPEIKEIKDSEKGKFAGFPDISSAVIGKIGRMLLEEVENMQYLKKIGNNAPFDNISEK